LQKLLFSLLIAISTYQVFSAVRGNDFVWSDQELVVENPALNPVSSASISKIWSTSNHSIYAPITESMWTVMAPFALNANTNKLSPRLFHSANLAFHILNAILVLYILSFFFKSSYPPFIGAMLFALHPLQVEPVAWISAFSHILGTTFGLISLITFMSYSKARDNATGWKARKPVFRYYFATFTYVLSVLAMPAMVVLPLAGMLLERQIPKKDSLSVPHKPMLPMAAWLVIGLPIAIIAISLQETHAISSETSMWFRPMIAGDSLAFFINKLFVPLGLGPDYGRSPAFLQSQWWGFFSWITPVFLMLVLTFWRDKSRRWFATGATMLVIGLLPFLGLVAFESQATSTVASRYAYFAMLGPALCLAYFVSIPKKPVFSLIAMVLIGLLGYSSTTQIGHWKNDSQLWKHSLNINPSSPVANRILGDKFRRAKEFGKAREHYMKVVDVNTIDPDVHFHLAEMQRISGNHAQAINLYQKTLKLEPSYTEVHYSLGLSLFEEKQYDLAGVQFQKALETAPKSPWPYYYLGRTALNLGKHKESIKPLQTALKLANENKEITENVHAFLGLSFHKLGDVEASKNHLEESLNLVSDQPESHRILANIYYEQEDFDKALKHYTMAAKKIQDDPEMLKNLGKILISKKKFTKALANFETVLTLKENDAESVHLVGVCNFRMRRFKTAREKFRKALELNKNLADAHYYLGDIARWSGENDRALAAYYKALRIEKHHPLAHYRLGNHFMKQERVKQAIRHYHSALKKAPNDIHVKANLKRAKSKLENM
jgi:protein O-mannosyl-transferase